MMNKNDKVRKKQILKEIEEKQKKEFEESLPMERENFKKLFDYLDKELSAKGCNGTNILTKNYLDKIGQQNVGNILEWLSSEGGFCDCEILANIEYKFEQMKIYRG